MPLRRCSVAVVAAAVLIVMVGHASAQLAHHPFAVGASEGAIGHQSGFGAWVLGMESRFYLQLTGAVRAAKVGIEGSLLLVGLSFAYGVFHAAGPGHGKAIITSYMVSNEVALRRGLLIALAAALLQGIMATAIVGIAALVFHATATRMTEASQTIELASYVGIVALGAMLVWRKGRALWVAMRIVPPRVLFATVLDMRAQNNLLVRAGEPGISNHEAGQTSLLLEPSWFETPPTEAPYHEGAERAVRRYALRASDDALESPRASQHDVPAPLYLMEPVRKSGRRSSNATRSRFIADDGHAHDGKCGCGHAHMPDPSAFAAARFDWRAAALAVVTAGARPCSGAILVLVFSLAQGMFVAGVAATFAIALGTAITTGALAIAAVYAKDLAMRLSGSGSTRALIAGRIVEFGAATCVLLFGLALLVAALGGVHAGA